MSTDADELQAAYRANDDLSAANVREQAANLDLSRQLQKADERIKALEAAKGKGAGAAPTTEALRARNRSLVDEKDALEERRQAELERYTKELEDLRAANEASDAAQRAARAEADRLATRLRELERSEGDLTNERTKLREELDVTAAQYDANFNRQQQELAEVASERDSARAQATAVQTALEAQTRELQQLEVARAALETASATERAEHAAEIETARAALDAVTAARDEGSRRTKAARNEGSTSPGSATAVDPSLPAFVFGKLIDNRPQYSRGSEDLDDGKDTLTARGRASQDVRPSQGGGGAAAPDTSVEDAYEQIAAAAVPYRHRGTWISLERGDKTKVVAGVAKSAYGGPDMSAFGKSGSGIVFPTAQFLRDIQPVPAVQDGSAVPSFHPQDDTAPLYIKLIAWEGDPASLPDQYKNYFNRVFEIEGFSLLSESFLKTKAEAMRLVRDVVKRAVGLDNNARERAKEGAGAIVRDATWTLGSLRNPGATGAAASLFEAARDMMSIRSDLGRSWRSGPTVAMITRTASTSALDFVEEELLWDSGAGAATRGL
jgi:hypothetical protein